MTKQNTKTKKNVTWKLKDLPTAQELADLVSNKILTVDEAREIVLGSAENDKAKVESLEALVEYLQGLVTELVKKNNVTYLPYTKTVYIDRPARPYWDHYWMNTHTVLCDAGLNVSDTSNKSSANYSIGSDGSVTDHKRSEPWVNGGSVVGKAGTTLVGNNLGTVGDIMDDKIQTVGYMKVMDNNRLDMSEITLSVTKDNIS